MPYRNEPKYPHPPILKPPIPPAPHLTSRGACSECHIPAVVAGDGDMKVCPRCYAMLWHRDYASEQRLQRQEAARLAAQAAEIRRAEKEAQKRLERELGEKQVTEKPPETI
jgi:hypothetical protein